MSQETQYDVVVVGAGVFGLATALELARRGHSVVTVDRFGTGHPATSSTGASRGIRIAYNDPFYVRLAMDAIERWRAVEMQTSRTVLHLTGQIDCGPDDTLAAILGAVETAGGEIDELGPANLRRLLPELDPDRRTGGLFHADGGTVMAAEGLLALTDAATAAGVTMLAPERVTAIHTNPEVVVETDWRKLSARHVVIAAGPWAGPLLKDLRIEVPLAPAIAQVTFLNAPAMVDRPGIGFWQADGPTGTYGHPVPGIGYKVAYDAGHEGWLPDTERWEPDADEERRLLAWLGRELPGASQVVARSERHPWTMTPDSDFVVDRRGPIVLACGCSGHAFKFGPALGPIVADVLEGAAPPDLLRLDRPGLSGTAAPGQAIAR